MSPENNFSVSIHTVLKDLIEAKSKRDNIKFTSYQLASAIAMPRSILTKLLHPDESKRVNNPKIETLLKIVDFFCKDGFNISIDDLLNTKNRSIDVQSQSTSLFEKACSLAVYSLNNAKEKVGVIDINISNSSKNLLALYAPENIEPFFKQGSVFIIDTTLEPVSESLIAVRLNNSEKIHIKKYINRKNTLSFISLAGEEDIMMFSTQSREILGVVIQINAKT